MPADRNAASLRLVAEQDGVRVWVPSDQRWERLGGRAVTLRPASRYLNHGMLVVGRPYQPNARTRDGQPPSQFDIGLAEPKPADYNGSG